MITSVKKQKIKDGLIIHNKPSLVLCPEYLDVYNTWINSPSSNDRYNQNYMFNKIVDRGYYAKAEFLDIFSVHTNDGGEAQKNWRNPLVFNPVLINTPTFLPYKGFYGEDGAGRVVDLQYRPNIDKTLITYTNFCLIVGNGTDDDNTRAFCGLNDGGTNIQFKGYSGNVILTMSNESETMEQTYNDAHHAVSRNNGLTIDCYRNNYYSTKSNTATTLSSKYLYACGISTLISSPKEIRYVFLFSYLTPTEVADVIEIMNEYLYNYSTHLYDIHSSIHDTLAQVSDKILIPGSEPWQWLGRGRFAVNSLGEWLLVYRHGTSHNNVDGNSEGIVRFSDDEGITWTDANTYTDGNPVVNAPFSYHVGNNNWSNCIVIECPNGNLLLHIWESGVNSGTYQWRSVDNGASWTDEGIITTYIGDNDYTVAGSDIYVCWRTGTGAGHTMYCYISTDNGLTWGLQGTIAGPPTNNDTNETGIQWIGGNNMIAVMRSANSTNTYQFYSNDLGVTWAQYDYTSQLRILHKPEMRILNGHLFLFGRDYEVRASTAVIYYSDDNGLNWSAPFYPDKHKYEDSAYNDLLARSNGEYYFLSYNGVLNSTDIHEYIFRFK